MICVPSPAELLLAEILPKFRPRPVTDSWEWICANGKTHEGVPFDGDMIPWCQGVCAALDDPETRVVALQWGTRLGKTTISHQWMACKASTSPRPGLLATSTQSLAERSVRNKIYPMLDHIPSTSRQLPHPRFRSLKEIRLSSSPWYVAWSGSDTQLADLSAFYGIGNEIDKWGFDEKLGGDAGEGDKLDLFFERFKEFYNATILIECSPSTKRKSRIEKWRLRGNNCHYGVPCPRCGGSQELKLGKEGEPGGIRFDREPNGASDPQLARSTARYVCEHCEYEISDDERPLMMSRGVWVPAGCYADKRGRVKGTPSRGPRVWSSRLSSLYSLQLRWGDIAEAFVRSKAEAQELRNFVNGWLAETWEPYQSKTEPEQVGQRLSTETPRGVVPLGCTWLFAAVDRQVDHYVYLVLAVGPDEREHVVDHGTCEDSDYLEHNVIRRRYEHEDGGPALSPFLTLVDCGYRAKEMYQFCQRFKGTEHNVFPIKGANTDCGGKPYERTVISAHAKNQRTQKALIKYGAGLLRFRCNPYYYEPIIQEQIDNLKPGEPSALTFHAECVNDTDFLRQLCNGAESEEPSKLDPNRHLWVKRWDNEKNDYRDTKKYARCAADVAFKGDWRRAEIRQGQPRKPVQQAVSEPAKGRDGRERFRFTRERRERTRR